jgi:hypothetical protein
MSDFNPSSRISGKLERLCSHCEKTFICDGSCENPNATHDKDFCYCVLCWDDHFGSKNNIDKNRGKCHILEIYLNSLGREEEFKALSRPY